MELTRKTVMYACIELLFRRVISACAQLLPDIRWSHKAVLERRSRGQWVDRYCLPPQRCENFPNTAAELKSRIELIKLISWVELKFEGCKWSFCFPPWTVQDVLQLDRNSSLWSELCPSAKGAVQLYQTVKLDTDHMQWSASEYAVMWLQEWTEAIHCTDSEITAGVWAIMLVLKSW